MSIISLPIIYEANIIKKRCRKPTMVNLIDIVSFEIPEVENLEEACAVFYEDRVPEYFFRHNDDIFMELYFSPEEFEKRYKGFADVQKLNDYRLHIFREDFNFYNNYKFSMNTTLDTYESDHLFKEILSDNKQYVYNQLRQHLQDNMLFSNEKLLIKRTFPQLILEIDANYDDCYSTEELSVQILNNERDDNKYEAINVYLPYINHMPALASKITENKEVDVSSNIVSIRANPEVFRDSEYNKKILERQTNVVISNILEKKGIYLSDEVYMKKINNYTDIIKLLSETNYNEDIVAEFITASEELLEYKIDEAEISKWKLHEKRMVIQNLKGMLNDMRHGTEVTLNINNLLKPAIEKTATPAIR